MTKPNGGPYRGFVERAEEIVREIDQIFLDASHWNTVVRKSNEPKIDPDPCGTLRSAKRSLEDFIAKAAGG